VTVEPPIKKIVSGGQTGADRAALDYAIAYGIQHGGGWQRCLRDPWLTTERRLGGNPKPTGG
jgi:hypothetical protein